MAKKTYVGKAGKLTAKQRIGRGILFSVTGAVLMCASFVVLEKSFALEDKRMEIAATNFASTLVAE